MRSVGGEIGAASALAPKVRRGFASPRAAPRLAQPRAALLSVAGGAITTAALPPSHLALPCAQVGPLGLSPKKVGEDIQKATMVRAWRGLRANR